MGYLTWSGVDRAPKEKGIDDRISLSVGSIAVMEENAVVKYLDMMLLYFRTNVHASYSIIVKVCVVPALWLSLRPPHVCRRRR